MDSRAHGYLLSLLAPLSSRGCSSSPSTERASRATRRRSTSMEIAVSTGLYGILLSPSRRSGRKKPLCAHVTSMDAFQPRAFIVGSNVHRQLLPFPTSRPFFESSIGKRFRLIARCFYSSATEKLAKYNLEKRVRCR